MKPKILIVEHDAANIKLIHNELEKSKVNFTSEIVHTRKEYKKALLDFKPDIILSHYTFPAFDGPAAFKIKNKLSPEIPYFFVSESIGEETAIEWIKNGVSDFVLNESISSLPSKINRALKVAKIGKLNIKHQQTEERRIAELSYNAQKYYSVIESSMDAILITLKDGVILEANTAACEIFQMTREEICKLTRFDIIDNKDHRLQSVIKERDRTGNTRGELRFKRKDGSLFPGELSSVVFMDANGLEKTSLTIKDLTGRKQAEKKQLATSNALQEALNARNKILDSSLDVICSFDAEGRFVSASDAAETIWGYSPEDLMGKNHIDFVFHEDTKSTLAIFAKIKTGVPVTMFENRFIDKNGSIVPMLWSSRWDDRDKLNYAVAKDATEKKSLETAFHIERERFHDLFSQAPTCMGILKGPDYVYEMVNPKYLKMIGKKDIIGKTLKEVLPELLAQGIMKFVDPVYKTGVTFTANEMLVKLDLDGTGALVDTYKNFMYQAYRNNQGEIEGIFFFVLDVTEQVLSRKKIEESENRFRALIEKSEEMIILSSEDGEIIYSSPSVMKIFEFASEEVPHKLSFDFIHPDDINDYIIKRNKVLETPGASFYHQLRVLDNNGKWLWCENTITNMLHEPGVYALTAHIRDITEKKMTEQQREFDQKNLSALINNTDDLMWSVDRDFKLITSNKPFKAITTSILGNKIKKGSNVLASRFSPDMINHYKISCERAFAGTTFSEIEYREKPVEMWAEISYYPIRKGNEIIGTACHSRNITEQKQNELHLENQNKALVFQAKEKEKIALRLNAINKELADYKVALDETSIVAITDEKGIIQYANDNFCKISKYSRKELIGIDHRIINSGFHPKEFFQTMWETIAEGKTWKGEIKNRAKDGAHYWVDTTITPFLDEKGKPYQYVASRYDITERKQAKLILQKKNQELAFQNVEKENRATELIGINSELLKTNGELDRFVYSVSHDLRSPLTSILGLISFVEEESQETETLEHVAMIRNSVNRLDEFIKNILSYSRNKRTGLEVEIISPQDTANEIVDSLLGMKEAEGIRFEIDISEQQAFYSDKIRFNTVLENLISNAIKYHQKDQADRYIKITGQADQDSLQLTITDNGIGIAAKHHDKIFDMFYRLSGKKDGSGIGLYIVKETVQILQGSIEVQSEEGEGTSFYITLKNLKP